MHDKTSPLLVAPFLWSIKINAANCSEPWLQLAVNFHPRSDGLVIIVYLYSGVVLVEKSLRIFMPFPEKCFFEKSPITYNEIMSFLLAVHPWKLTCPLKKDYFSREYIFQPLIFRGHVSFQGGKASIQMKHMFWLDFVSTKDATQQPWRFCWGGFSPFDWIISLHSGASKRWKQQLTYIVIILQYSAKSFTSISNKMEHQNPENYYPLPTWPINRLSRHWRSPLPLP